MLLLAFNASSYSKPVIFLSFAYLWLNFSGQTVQIIKRVFEVYTVSHLTLHYDSRLFLTRVRSVYQSNSRISFKRSYSKERIMHITVFWWYIYYNDKTGPTQSLLLSSTSSGSNFTKSSSHLLHFGVLFNHSLLEQTTTSTFPALKNNHFYCIIYILFFPFENEIWRAPLFEEIKVLRVSKWSNSKVYKSQFRHIPCIQL